MVRGKIAKGHFVQGMQHPRIFGRGHTGRGRTNIAPPPLVRGEDTFAGWRGGGGSIFWKTPDTTLYSTYVSTLWYVRTIAMFSVLLQACLKDGAPQLFDMETVR